MHIVGGTYLEKVIEPSHEIVLGSALRGATALKGVADVVVHTCLDEKLDWYAQSAASIYGFKMNPTLRQSPIIFSYDTPVSSPIIEGFDQPYKSISLSDGSSNVLVYGMLEASTEVSANAIVLDPQGMTKIDRTRFCCERFAIVANSSEVMYLGGTNDVASSAMKLLVSYEADSVVVKCGALGASVFQKDGSRTNIGVYATEKVFPIGSGDIFSAVFAWAWMEENRNPVDAAQLASAATSFYCKYKEPVPLKGGILPESIAAGTQMRFKEDRVKVYLAGPFFSLHSRWLINTTRNALNQLGASVFSPFHDVGFGDDEVAAKDISSLATSDTVLALLDGSDAGTLFEVGYARSKNTPVIAFTATPLSDDLVMARGSGCTITDDLSTAIYKSVWKGLAVHEQ